MTSNTILATSTAVEHVFSQGCQLLHFTCNHLSGASIQSLLCFGDWSQKDLIATSDVVEAIRHSSSMKHNFASAYVSPTKKALQIIPNIYCILITFNRIGSSCGHMSEIDGLGQPTLDDLWGLMLLHNKCK
jgi:hypothetical protein